jgi:Sec-independent protein translocase protein TatA
MRNLSQLAETEIDALEADGIRLAARQVIRIAWLASLVETPQTRIELARGRPVPVGGVTLWPLTLAGGEWFRRHVDRYRGETMQALVLAYAMAHGRDELPEEHRAVDRALQQFRRAIRCRRAELHEAIRQVTEQDDREDTGETGPRVTAGEISATLTAMTGAPAAVWEQQCSIGYVLAVLDTLAAQNAAEGKSTKHDPRIRAERALGLYVKRIRDRSKASTNG